MKVSFYNIGCKLNFAEMSQMQKEFEDAGFEVVDFKEQSDIVLINTCTVTHHADADSRKYIRRAIRNNPDAFIGVMGCYSQLKPDEIVEIDGVDAVLGTNNKFDIRELIRKFEKKNKPEIFIPDLNEVSFHFASSADNENRTRMVLKIQDGCDYVCTYCAVPYARGGSRSMDFDELKQKLIDLNNTDYHEIILSGINLGEYKAPTGENFTNVIRFMAETDLNYRVRISSIEPNLITDELIRIVKTADNICRHFHVPLQSGSTEILKLMKRRYKVETFENLVIKIKAEIPDCCIGVDVIEGFPGETDEHFKETYNLLDSLPISYLHVFTYSERDITPASKYPNQVQPGIRKERTKRLRKLSDKMKKEFIQSQTGKTGIVIPEDEKLENGKIIMEGWTGNYIRVRFETANLSHLPTRVKITGYDNGIAIAEII
ncbi:tRNA (N(6)-L-threonylcarbamoyladenosine(37)-C(2))-methylthiotransferase MtaB [Bacteroidota bacterium]